MTLFRIPNESVFLRFGCALFGRGVGDRRKLLLAAWMIDLHPSAALSRAPANRHFLGFGTVSVAFQPQPGNSWPQMEYGLTFDSYLGQSIPSILALFRQLSTLPDQDNAKGALLQPNGCVILALRPVCP